MCIGRRSARGPGRPGVGDVGGVRARVVAGCAPVVRFPLPPPLKFVNFVIL